MDIITDKAPPAPTRPALRWHGGKWRLAPWIIAHLPAHHVYTETFGGGASVLLRKVRSYAEVYNDLDVSVVSFFRVLQDPASAARLRELLFVTPFAREELALAYQPSDDPVEAARRLVIRSFQGFSSNGHNIAQGTGFRSNSKRSGTTPARDWMNYPDQVMRFTARMRGVVLENKNALEILATHDSPRTVHYVDPPYLPETRAARPGGADGLHKAYAHEMSPDDHVELLAVLRGLKGMVLLSGYPSDLYDQHLTGWVRVERAALADGARPRTECLWMNPAAAAACPAPHQRGLFEVADV